MQYTWRLSPNLHLCMKHSSRYRHLSSISFIEHLCACSGGVCLSLRNRRGRDPIAFSATICKNRGHTHGTLWFQKEITSCQFYWSMSKITLGKQGIWVFVIHYFHPCCCASCRANEDVSASNENTDQWEHNQRPLGCRFSREKSFAQRVYDTSATWKVCWFTTSDTSSWAKSVLAPKSCLITFIFMF